MTTDDQKDDISNATALLDDLKDKLCSNGYLSVIRTVSEKPPNCKDAQLQRDIAVPVLDALRMIKRGSIAATLSEMSSDQRTVLLQYVYYGFQANPQFSADYLNWQSEIVKKDGVGCIVRIATNIKRNILVAADDTTGQEYILKHAIKRTK